MNDNMNYEHWHFFQMITEPKGIALEKPIKICVFKLIAIL